MELIMGYYGLVCLGICFFGKTYRFFRTPALFCRTNTVRDIRRLQKRHLLSVRRV